jgi:hypothetical protein
MGGGDDDFRIFMVYCVKKSFLECPGRMNKSTLVGTICYYPNNSDFYFFGSNTFDVDVSKDGSSTSESISNRNMVFKIICKLCGIEEGRKQGIKLRAACDDPEGIFIKTTTSFNWGRERFGIIYYVKNIRYCLRLNTIRFLSPSLEFIKYSRDVYDGKWKQKGKASALPSEGNPEFSSIDICKLDKKPNTLSNVEPQKLLDDGDNVVLLDEFKSADIKYGTRGYLTNKKAEEIFTNASILSTSYVPEVSKEYKQCLTAPNPPPQ